MGYGLDHEGGGEVLQRFLVRGFGPRCGVSTMGNGEVIIDGWWNDGLLMNAICGP